MTPNTCQPRADSVLLLSLCYVHLTGQFLSLHLTAHPRSLMGWPSISPAPRGFGHFGPRSPLTSVFPLALADESRPTCTFTSESESSESTHRSKALDLPDLPNDMSHNICLIAWAWIKGHTLYTIIGMHGKQETSIMKAENNCMTNECKLPTGSLAAGQTQASFRVISSRAVLGVHVGHISPTSK